MSEIDVQLLIPPKLFLKVFPWSTLFLKRYIEDRSKVVVDIWDIQIGLPSPNLTDCYSWETFFSGDTSASIYYQFINSYHKKQDIEELVGDAKLSATFSLYIDYLKNEFRMRGRRGKPQVWGISVNRGDLIETLFIAWLLKQQLPSSFIVLGGDFFDENIARAVIEGADSFIDKVIVGRGEQIFFQVVKDALKIKHSDLKQKVLFRKQYDFDSRVLVAEELSGDDFPKAAMRENDLYIMSSRGCKWGKCLFCSEINGNFVPASFEQIWQEVKEQLHSVHSPISMVTSSSLDNNAVAPRIAEKLIAEGYEVKRVYFWYRVDSLTDEVRLSLKRLSDLGVTVVINLGIESLSQTVLDKMNKGVSVLQNIYALKVLHDIGASGWSLLIFKYPKKRKEEFLEELENLKSIRHFFVSQRVGLILSDYDYIGKDVIASSEEYKDMFVLKSYEKSVLNSYAYRCFKVKCADDFCSGGKAFMFSSMEHYHWNDPVSPNVEELDILKKEYLKVLQKKNCSLFLEGKNRCISVNLQSSGKTVFKLDKNEVKLIDFCYSPQSLESCNKFFDGKLSASELDVYVRKLINQGILIKYQESILSLPLRTKEEEQAWKIMLKQIIAIFYGKNCSKNSQQKDCVNV